ncbi:stalk domain-containing protein [Paenibacillus sp. NPDC056579]|uniref:stalk domain-containing protein n=1 Tax=Paenibacillus sp. NPDC056579 TaxID=3345871 RepID=UPI0036C0E40B
MKRWTWLTLILGIAVGLSLPAGNGYAEEKLIEDPVLEAAIKQELKLTQDAELTQEHLLQLTSLYPKGEGKIRSLKGLEYAQHLTGLYLPNQEIKDIAPLEKLTSIARLGLNSNQIENICPIANMYELKQLVISGNNIQSIDCLSQNYNLTDLLIGKNKVQDITALAHLPLKWVGLENNQITDIQPLEDHATLETVYLNNNNIQDIRPLTSIKNLKTVVLKDNPLKDAGKPIIDQLTARGVTINEMQSGTKAPKDITVKVDGQRVVFNENPTIVEGSTMVQFHPLFEALGVQIEWDESKQEITGKKQGLQIDLKMNNPTATVNGVKQMLPVAPMIINGNAFVPVRFISEALHYDVVWDAVTKTINMYTEWQEFASDDRTWSFKASHKWKDLSRSQPPGYYVDVYAVFNKAEFIFFEDKYSPAQNLNEYVEAINKYDAYEGITLISDPKTFSINGLDAIEVFFTTKSLNNQAKVHMIIIQGKHRFYRLGIGSLEKDFDDYSNELMEIAKTFRELPTPQEKVAEKFKGMSAEQRIRETFAFYKQMGFFQSVDAGAAEKTFLDNYAKEFAVDEEYDPYRDHTYYQVFADLFILEHDKSRVWMEDTEADVGKGNNVYVRVLKDWAKISRGAFQPTNIEETWNSQNGPVKVTFTLNGEEVTLYPQNLNDFIDVGIVKKINAKIAGSGYQFAVVVMDQSAFVTVLNEQELAKIRNERFWPLVEL